ncbi:MAG TPA: RNA polymerase sigma factor [Chloroflexota bacterium]
MYPEAGDDLIARARDDRAAFGDIYDIYVRRVYAFCLARTGNQQEAEELTSQTFERALNAISRYESRGAPMSSWLFRIAANLVTDRGRRGARLQTVGDTGLAEQWSEDPDDNPADLVERWERAAILRAYISDLPADQQEAIRLRYWLGLSTFDLARRLNRSEGAAKQLLHRALTSLRARLETETARHVE